MKAYQLFVQGESSLGGSFIMHHGLIYKHKPTEKEKEYFISCCRDKKYLCHLVSEKVECKALEVEIVD